MSRYSSAERQLDIPASLPNFFHLPKSLPGVLTAIDFVHFQWPRTLDASKYQVVVEVLDTSENNPYHSISTLTDEVFVPFVQFPWNAKIGVLPNTTALPSFVSTLSRGATYIIPDTRGQSGVHDMKMLGVLRPCGR